MQAKQTYESELLRSMPDFTGHLAIYIAEDCCAIACCSRSFFLAKLVTYHKPKQQYPHEFIQDVFAQQQAFFARNFQQISIGVQTKHFTLLPNKATIKAEDAIQFLTQSPTRTTYTNLISSIDAQLAYSLPVDLVTVCNNNFEQYEITHCAKFAIENCLQSEQLYLHIEDSYFDCVVRNESGLQSATRHTYNAKEDVLYYSLLALKDAHLDAKTVTARCTGKITKHDELYSFLINYIEAVHIEALPQSIRHQTDFEMPLQEHQYLLNLLNENN